MSYNQILSNIKTVENKVKYLLDVYPELKDKSYNHFLAKYWSVFDHIDISPEFISKLTNCETIRRTRQKLASMYPDKYGSKDMITREIAYEEYSTS